MLIVGFIWGEGLWLDLYAVFLGDDLWPRYIQDRLSPVQSVSAPYGCYRYQWFRLKSDNPT